MNMELPKFDLSALNSKNAVGVGFSQENSTCLEVIHSKGYAGHRKEVLSRFDAATNNSLRSHPDDSLAGDVVLVRVPKDLILDKPALFSINAKGFPASISVLIIGEPGCSATLLFKKRAEGAGPENNYFRVNFKVVAEKNSQLSIVNLLECSDNVLSFEDRAARVSSDAIVNWIDLNLGAGYSSSSVASELAEEGASSNVRYLFAGRNSQEYDIFTSTVHSAPHTNSNMLTRGVVNGRSKVLSRGLILMGKNAGGSHGFEKQDSLVLSEDAVVDAIPNLEIHNHDVKCSHGSTIGQVDAEKVFYLMARGLSEEDAKKLIIQGYFAQVMGLFGEQERSELEQALEKAIS